MTISYQSVTKRNEGQDVKNWSLVAGNVPLVVKDIYLLWKPLESITKTIFNYPIVRKAYIFGPYRSSYRRFTESVCKLCPSTVFLYIIHVRYNQISLIYSTKCDYSRNSAIRENKHEQTKSALSAHSNDIPKFNMLWRARMLLPIRNGSICAI